MYFDDPDPADIDYMRAEDAAERRYQRRLARNPDCRDPEHPGCELCEPDEDGEE